MRVIGKDSEANRFWMSTEGKSSLIVDIKASSDVYISLGGLYGDTVYEIQMLNSTTNTSRITNIYTDDYNSAETPELFDGAAFLTFWVSWQSGYVSFGKGPLIGQNEILQLDPLPDQEERHIETAGFSAEDEADWMIFKEESRLKFYTCHT